MIRFLAALLTGLCVHATYAQAATSSHTFQFGGKERTYDLVVPDKSGPLPLVIALHPYPGNGTMMAELTGLSALAEKEGFLLAYPEGLMRSMRSFAAATKTTSASSAPPSKRSPPIIRSTGNEFMPPASPTAAI